MVLTERLEMRFDPETVARLDEWRRDQADVPSRSEAVRRLVEQGLEASVHRSSAFVPSNTEKLMLWMLSQIRRDLVAARDDQKDAKYDLKDLDLIDEAIYGGHFWGLTWEMSGIFHDHVDDPRHVRDVVDILDTWNFIERAYEGFNPEQKQSLESQLDVWGKDPKFYGFDGNNETEHMGIARFLIDRLGRFERFKGRDLNSHMPTVSRYLQMARRFENIRPNLHGRELNVTEMIDLLRRERG